MLIHVSSTSGIPEAYQATYNALVKVWPAAANPAKMQTGVILGCVRVREVIDKDTPVNLEREGAQVRNGPDGELAGRVGVEPRIPANHTHAQPIHHPSNSAQALNGKMRYILEHPVKFEVRIPFRAGIVSGSQPAGNAFPHPDNLNALNAEVVAKMKRTPAGLQSAPR